MIDRTGSVGQKSTAQRRTDLVDLIETALMLATELEQHLTAAALNDAVIHAQRTADKSG